MMEIEGAGQRTSTHVGCERKGSYSRLFSQDWDMLINNHPCVLEAIRYEAYVTFMMFICTFFPLI